MTGEIGTVLDTTGQVLNDETTQLKIPKWLEEGTVRNDTDSWSDASSDAEDVARVDDLDSFNPDYDLSVI